jgi:dynein heavy chain, axonemal
MADPRRVGASPAALTRLWLHECDRVFADRLTCSEDKNWFAGLTQRHVGTSLGLDWSAVTEQQQQQQQQDGSSSSTSSSTSSSSAAVFVDFMIPGADPRVYEEVSYTAVWSRCVPFACSTLCICD